MEPDTARFWLDAIAIGAALVWVAACWFVADSRRRLAEPLAGAAELAGRCDELLARAAKALIRGEASSPLQRIRVDSLGGGELVWHGSFPAARHRGELRLEPAGAERCRALWSVSQGTRLLGARVVLLFGALTVVGLYVLLRAQVLPSDAPGVRGQVVQMAQVIHVLWPPFLIAGIARRMRRQIGEAVERLVVNLAYDAE